MIPEQVPSNWIKLQTNRTSYDRVGRERIENQIDNDADAHDARVSVSASGRRRLRERHVHPAEATLAQPGRSVDVDEHEPSDVVRRPGRRQQSLSERQHSPGEGL